MSKKSNSDLPVTTENFLQSRTKYINVTEAWSLDPVGILEILFHFFKQENHFICRRFDRISLKELQGECEADPKGDRGKAIETIFQDYDDNTEMKMTKYSKGGLVAFKKYYQELLLEDGLDPSTL